MIINLLSEQDFDVLVYISSAVSVCLPAGGKQSIEVEEKYPIILSFHFIEEEYKHKYFWRIVAWLVDMILVMFDIASEDENDNNEIRQFGGDEENFLDTKILLAKTFDVNAVMEVQVIYKKAKINGVWFNVGEVQKLSDRVTYEYSANQSYKQKVRKRMWAYVLFAISASLIWLWFIWSISGRNQGIKILLIVVGVLFLKYYSEHPIEEYKKWKYLFGQEIVNKKD